MRDITCFSASTVAKFDNNYDNMLQFNEVLLDTAHNVYDKYNKEESNTIIRNQMNKIFGIDFKKATPMQRRQAFRLNKNEFFNLVEDVIVDRMTSGWNAANSFFMDYVETKNIAAGDQNEFYVNDNSLLQVSKFSGNHHDIVRQNVTQGVAFRVDTSWYVIKAYTEFELCTAFMSMDESLPSDMILETPLSESTKDAVVDQIEAVKAATGYDVVLVGTRTAIQKLQNTVNYNMWSNDMKNERYQNGLLANWEGYTCLPLSRVNIAGTRDSVFSADDNKKIFILPVDPQFKPIKQVFEGEVELVERNTTGNENMDRTMEASIWYREGVGVVINQLFGEIKIATSVSA